MQVKLFNYPCVIEDAPGRSYGGHSSHVMCVRWAANQAYAVSAGGHDRAVFQWRLVGAPSNEEKQAAHLRQQRQQLAAVAPSGVMYSMPNYASKR